MKSVGGKKSDGAVSSALKREFRNLTVLLESSNKKLVELLKILKR